MNTVFHITSGDIAGGNLAKAGLPGEVFVWHDILYDGPRQPGWPDEKTLRARALFLEAFTAGGLDRDRILQTFHTQYQRLAEAGIHEQIVLWFDACLFDQSMLAHILTCLSLKGIQKVELLCIDAFPGIQPFHGLGQLRPEQLASLYPNRRSVTDAQFRFAAVVDNAFASQDLVLLTELSEMTGPPLPWIPAAATRWLQEQPDPATGLGRLESLALAAIREGCETPGKIFAAAAAADTPPQFWGDTTLWAKINGLADRVPPLVQIEGPAPRLPQWESPVPLMAFRIKALPDIEITPFDISFYDDVFALWQRCDGMGLSDADSRDGIQTYLERNPGMSFVASSSGKIVGAILAGHDGRRGYIHHLAVHPDFRKMGLARRLVDRSVEKLRDSGIRKCHLFVFSNNHAGLAFWQKVGWRRRLELSIVSRQTAEDGSENPAPQQPSRL